MKAKSVRSDVHGSVVAGGAGYGKKSMVAIVLERNHDERRKTMMAKAPCAAYAGQRFKKTRWRTSRT